VIYFNIRLIIFVERKNISVALSSVRLRRYLCVVSDPISFFPMDIAKYLVVDPTMKEKI